jgi:hypothetical protein
MRLGEVAYTSIPSLGGGDGEDLGSRPAGGGRGRFGREVRETPHLNMPVIPATGEAQGGVSWSKADPSRSTRQYLKTN